MPGENVAQGWLNEIEPLAAIRQRMAAAARITGWDVFTFHTLHNVDRFFDTTIAAVRETWVKEGSLSHPAIREAKRQFSTCWDYHRIHARLIENLVFQSSLLDWVKLQVGDAPLRLHVVGTALLSALASTGAISFASAVESALKFGSRWDEAVRTSANASTDEEAAQAEFRQIRRLIEGRLSLSMGVSRSELPSPDAPGRPFWYSATVDGEAALITTAQEAADALETMNLASWSYASGRPENEDRSIRGWLVSPMHPMARACRWSVSNYLLATPASIPLFVDHIAPLGREPIVEPASEPIQNRLRLSRMKVTGP